MLYNRRSWWSREGRERGKRSGEKKREKDQGVWETEGSLEASMRDSTTKRSFVALFYSAEKRIARFHAGSRWT
jgi:hypothetical protein